MSGLILNGKLEIKHAENIIKLELEDKPDTLQVYIHDDIIYLH